MFWIIILLAIVIFIIYSHLNRNHSHLGKTNVFLPVIVRGYIHNIKNVDSYQKSTLCLYSDKLTINNTQILYLNRIQRIDTGHINKFRSVGLGLSIRRTFYFLRIYYVNKTGNNDFFMFITESENVLEYLVSKLERLTGIKISQHSSSTPYEL